MEAVLQDLRYARRSIRRFLVANIALTLLLAIGSGAIATVLTLVHRVLLAPASAPRPNELVLLHRITPSGGRTEQFPIALARELQKSARSLSALAAFDYTRLDVRVGSVTESATGRILSGSGFALLGAQAIIGRPLTEDDDAPHRANVALISFGYWQRRFGADPTVVGASVGVNGVAITIAGVLPEYFTGLSVGEAPEDLWVPLELHAALGLNDHPDVALIGRLRPGATLAVAQSELTATYRSAQRDGIVIENAAGPSDRSRIDVIPSPQGIAELPRLLRTPIQMLLAVGILLLGVVWINAAGLMAARTRVRARELVLKLAIGASRARLVQQLLIENLFVTVPAAALGAVVAWWSTPWLFSMLAGNDAQPLLIATPDLVLGLTMTGVAVIGAALFSVVQGAIATGTDVTAELRGSRGPSHGRRLTQLGRHCVSIQLAVSLVLILTGLLMADAVRHIETVQAGFDREHVLIFWTFAGRHGYAGAREQWLYRELTIRLAAIPGARSASVARYRPGLARGATCRPSREAEQPPDVFVNTVGPGYFATMGIPLLAGREFDWSDNGGAANVIIVARTVADALFAGHSPVGQRLLIPDGPREGATVVGVAGDVASYPMRPGLGVVPTCQVYQPIGQAKAANLGQMNLVVRAQNDPLALVSDARSVVNGLDPQLSILDAQSGAASLHRFYGREEMVAWFALGISLVALVVAGTGLYGTLTLTVSSRARELGIRAALGARASDAVAGVMADTARIVGAGCAAGLGVALVSTVLLRSSVFGLDRMRLVPTIGAALVLAIVSLLAAYVPAARAASVDPAIALKEE